MSSMQRVMNGINVFSPLHVKMKRKIICRKVNEKNVVLAFVVQMNYYYSKFPYFSKEDYSQKVKREDWPFFLRNKSPN